MPKKRHVHTRVLVTLLFGTTAWMVATPVDAGPNWSIEESPNRADYSDLYDVSCVSPTWCNAVGFSYTTRAKHRTLVESWNGSAWSISSSPNRVTNTYNNDLYGVSCVSMRSCKAVGESWNAGGPRTLIESWNGSTWSLSPSPTTAISTLQGVSCVAANRCKAVGYRQDSRDQLLIESWNGTAWSISPNPISGRAWLLDVSCVSANSCKAVGYLNALGPGARTLVLSWNGTAWSRISSPNPGAGSALDDVSCASANSCKAVGYYRSGGRWRTLVESWNGNAWSVVPSPNRCRDNYLLSVSCPSANSCKAVGYYGDDRTRDDTLVLSWNGSVWTRMSSPNRPSGFDLLRGVSCATASSCKAVGFGGGTLVESFG